MQKLDENQMKDLSFPDFDVEKIEFFPEEKILTIFVEGAFLDIDEGFLLGRGVLYFNDWVNFSVRRFDPHTEKWSNVALLGVEHLKDLCEVKFRDSSILLCGFGKGIIGHWMEWEIHKAKMHAEFDS